MPSVMSTVSADPARADLVIDRTFAQVNTQYKAYSTDQRILQVILGCLLLASIIGLLVVAGMDIDHNSKAGFGTALGAIFCMCGYAVFKQYKDNQQRMPSFIDGQGLLTGISPTNTESRLVSVPRHMFSAGIPDRESK